MTGNVRRDARMKRALNDGEGTGEGGMDMGGEGKDELSVVNDEAGEWYIDALTGVRRRRRGKSRRHSRGPMSDSEYLMSRQFQHMLTDLRRMHGSLADVVAKHFTAEIAAYRIVLREFSYENVPEPDADDVREIKETFGIAERPVAEEEFDLGKLT